jgi:hypothetical protein
MELVLLIKNDESVNSNRFIINGNINRFGMYGKFLAFINIFNESS